MNWTGGRLHRHSNKNHRTSTQSGRRFPLKQGSDSNNRHSGSIFPGLNELSPQRGDTQSPHQADISGGVAQRLPRPSHLDQIKRQLLEASDWGAVAAARPLKISFTPLDEAERFGKRRRLTDSDHDRLESYSLVKRPRERHRHLSSDFRSIEGVDIKINGERIHGKHASTEEDHLRKSSQPMLLDQDLTVPAQELPHRCDDHILPLAPISGTPVHLPPAYNENAPRFSLFAESTTLDNHMDVGPRDYRCPTRDSLSPRPYESDFTSRLPSPVFRRRYTIDDQVDEVIAANEGRDNAVSTIPGTPRAPPGQEYEEKLFHQSILSSGTLEELGYHHAGRQTAATDRLSTSSNQNSASLPKTYYNIHRNIPCESSGMDLRAHNIPSSHENLLPPLFTQQKQAFEAPNSTPSMKIFGQSIAPNVPNRRTPLRVQLGGTSIHNGLTAGRLTRMNPLSGSGYSNHSSFEASYDPSCRNEH